MYDPIIETFKPLHDVSINKNIFYESILYDVREKYNLS